MNTTHMHTVLMSWLVIIFPVKIKIVCKFVIPSISDYFYWQECNEIKIIWPIIKWNMIILIILIVIIMNYECPNKFFILQYFLK